VLVVAPKFTADIDSYERGVLPNVLYWAEKGPDVPLGHTWRYGSDAMNNNYTTNISSYDAMDKMVEYFLMTDQTNTSKNNTFPSLKRIVLAGHSAGGQFIHRWTMLSSSPIIWQKQQKQNQGGGGGGGNNIVEVRSIVANPRSYCYLDGRRIRFDDDNRFDIPNKEMIEACPSYNQWQWGLDTGGDIISHYKDRVLNSTTALDIRRRYASRHVFYLAGEFDTIEQEDRCETYSFQGSTRNQRAHNYFKALNEIHPNHSHQFHVVPRSPHDHALMFQSQAGWDAIFGETTKMNQNPTPSSSWWLPSLFHSLKDLTIELSFRGIKRGTLRSAEANRTK
jgi:hypothetical protein